MKLKRLDDQLNLLRMSGEKPNFAALAREFDCDYRTVKRHWLKGELEKDKRNKGSKLDDTKELIRAKLSIKGTTVRGVYEFIIDQKLYDGTYSNFRKYVKNNDLKPKTKDKGHGRFETPAGVQAQADWKEDFSLTSKNGELFEFNIFNVELTYSRLNHFELSITKDQNDVHRCLINSFVHFGGVPREIVFDNMATASIRVAGSNKRRTNPRLSVFARDFGFEVRLCKPGHSYTKGKVESRNKILDWLRPYDGEFETLEDLKEIVKKINIKANNYICQATNQPPTLLFQIEKEYLSPLPSKDLIETYQSSYKTKVGKDGMIYFRGNRYSVDPALIGETVGYEEIGNKLYIYYNLKLETVHEIENGKNKLKYKKEHYEKINKGKIREDDFDDFIKHNLENLDKLTGG